MEWIPEANRRRTQDFRGLSLRGVILSPAGTSFRGIDYPPVSHRGEPDDDSGRSDQIFSFVLSEYRWGNGERTEMSRYPTKNPSGTRSLTEVRGFVTISGTLLPISSRTWWNFASTFRHIQIKYDTIYTSIYIYCIRIYYYQFQNARAMRNSLTLLSLLNLIKILNLQNFTICNILLSA